jgi:hypothetical protein
MPETTMDKDDYVVTLEYKVRRPYKFLVMKPIAKSASVQILPDDKLGLGVLPFYTRHHESALLSGHDVHGFLLLVIDHPTHRPD